MQDWVAIAMTFGAGALGSGVSLVSKWTSQTNAQAATTTAVKELAERVKAIEMLETSKAEAKGRFQAQMEAVFARMDRFETKLSDHKAAGE
jgi:hypothetical protein